MGQLDVGATLLFSLDAAATCRQLDRLKKLLAQIFLRKGKLLKSWDVAQNLDFVHCGTQLSPNTLFQIWGKETLNLWQIHLLQGGVLVGGGEGIWGKSGGSWMDLGSDFKTDELD